MQRPVAPRTVLAGAATLGQVPLGRDNLGWVLRCTQTGAVALIDGPEAGPYLALLDAAGWRLDAVLVTHAHGDHVGVVHDLARRGRLAGVRIVGAAVRAADIPHLSEPVDEDDSVAIGALRLQVWRTEGHLRGHLSFVGGGTPASPGVVFCGDTMFAAGCGALFDGPAAAMAASLQRIAALPPATLVCCGHEYTFDNLRFAVAALPPSPALAARLQAVEALRQRGEAAVPSTVGEERATNPFVLVGSERGRALLATQGAACADPEAQAAIADFARRRAAKSAGRS